MRKLVVKLKPNIKNKDAWYYWEKNDYMIGRPIPVIEQDEPIFTDSYRMGHNSNCGTYFICKDDCIILKDDKMDKKINVTRKDLIDLLKLVKSDHTDEYGMIQISDIDDGEFCLSSFETVIDEFIDKLNKNGKR